MKAVFLDVGGTLWPDIIPTDPHRIRRVEVTLGPSNEHRAAEVCLALDAAARDLERATATLEQDTLGLIQGTLNRLGIDAERELADAVRRAMIPPASITRYFDGTPELLAALKRAGLCVVAVSNTSWRGSEDNAADFERAGLGDYFDGLVTSLDAGFRKPDPRIFEAAAAISKVDPRDTVMVGNSERNDVEPAVRLGMRAVLVAIEDPVPSFTQADAVVTSLHELRDLLLSWSGRDA